MIKKKNLQVKMRTELPPNWSWVKLSDIVENFKRGPFGSAIKKSFFVAKGYKVYEQKNAIYNSIELRFTLYPLLYAVMWYNFCHRL